MRLSSAALRENSGVAESIVPARAQLWEANAQFWEPAGPAAAALERLSLCDALELKRASCASHPTRRPSPRSRQIACAMQRFSALLALLASAAAQRGSPLRCRDKEPACPMWYARGECEGNYPVSYTHLTLPTKA